MLVGSAKRIFTKGPAGPAGATLAAALTDVSAGLKAVLTAPNLPAAQAALGLAIGSAVQAWSPTLDAIVTGGLSNAMLAPAPAYTLKANLLASAASPADVGLSALIDAVFGPTRGALLYRSASGWGLLPPGTAGQFLGTGGTGADPSWGTPAGAGNVSTSGSPTAGQLAVFASGTAIQGMGLTLGQCLLAYSSASALVLKPFRGALLWINGALRTIPAGGVSLANTGLTAATLYYVYAYMNGSTLTLEASTTGHTADATYGHEIKTGDATRTLVGMIYTDAGAPGTFADGLTKRYVLSWFNPEPIVLRAAVTGSTASTSMAPVSATTLGFLMWARQRVALEVTGSNSNTAISGQSTTNYLNGAAVGSVSGGSIPSQNYSASVSAKHLSAPGDQAEGLQTATVYGQVGSGTGTWSAVQTVETR